jgi:hypothetical protein
MADNDSYYTIALTITVMVIVGLILLVGITQCSIGTTFIPTSKGVSQNYVVAWQTLNWISLFGQVLAFILVIGLGIKKCVTETNKMNKGKDSQDFAMY